MEKYCFYCMRKKSDDGFCGHCGHKEVEDTYAHHLSQGTILNNRYMVGRVLGEGGFGITYIGRDTNLDMVVAVKEFFPTGFVNRNNTLSPKVTVTGDKNTKFFNERKTKFINEARVLAMFSGNSSIVDVRDYFEDNNTAYIIMEYVDGMNLKDYISQYGVFEAADIIGRMIPLCGALKKVHDAKLIHRDISPENIMILKDGSLKLMDFGAARDVNFDDQKSLSIMLKPGYAPEEQYRSKGLQGPWTDIYAICATIYKCITGVTPVDSLDRTFSDTVQPPSELGVKISAAQENALMKGMAIYQEDRFRDIDEFIAAVTGEYAPSARDKKSRKALIIAAAAAAVMLIIGAAAFVLLSNCSSDTKTTSSKTSVSKSSSKKSSKKSSSKSKSSKKTSSNTSTNSGSVIEETWGSGSYNNGTQSQNTPTSSTVSEEPTTQAATVSETVEEPPTEYNSDDYSEPDDIYYDDEDFDEE